MKRFEVYNKLRQMHSILKEVMRHEFDNEDTNTIEAINSVLYMADKNFATEEIDCRACKLYKKWKKGKFK